MLAPLPPKELSCGAAASLPTNADGDQTLNVLVSDDAVDDLRSASSFELVSFMEKDPRNIRQAVDLLSVVRNLERIADHATNIAEDVLFLVKGIDVRHHSETREESRMVPPTR